MIETSDNPLKPTFTLKVGQRQDWWGLHGSSIGLVLSQIGNQAPFIVLTPDSLTAQRIEEDIRFYAGESVRLLSFPDWETLPYDLFSPHQDIVSERLATLYQLPELTEGILIVPITTAMYRLPPREYVQRGSLLLQIGQKIKSTEHFRQTLESQGYRSVSQVMEHGEFAVRGGLIDLFPMGNPHPFRIDLLDNEIDTLRCFDPETQRTYKSVKEIRLLPAREIPLTESSIALFRQHWRAQIGENPTLSPVYQSVSRGLAPNGIESYLPLFFEQTNTFFDYLPSTSVIVTVTGVGAAAEQFWRDIQEKYTQRRHDIERPLLPPAQLFLQPNETLAQVNQYPHIAINQTTTRGIPFATLPPPTLTVDSRAKQPLTALKQFLQSFPGRVLLTVESAGRREVLLDLFKANELHPLVVNHWQDFLNQTASLCLTVADLEQGLVIGTSQTTLPNDSLPLAVICETQLFGERVAQRRLRQTMTQRETDAIVRNLVELSVGAPVVHEAHGVGRYQGLVTLEVGGILGEFLEIEYANQDKLYVPVSSLYLVNRFTGVDPEHAPLHRLGTGQWEKAKRKAAQQVCDVAVELLEIHARRFARPGQAFAREEETYQAFAATFPFEETPDQQSAINAVLSDMYAERPMDRLICGDVGFGKTEVAMRAAFVAVQSNQQVVMLVPTTLLTQQHYQNFQDRFADWPIRIEQLSRFSSKRQQDEVLKAISEGKVDIVIGTHKLLQDNIRFKQLGLVIIDEEHRFGVRQKERLKALRTEVDVLTLTATPIPRSLNMALSNMRDLSVIATPPSRRLAIKTFVKEWHIPSMIEAIVRELKRGGQVYFLHNDIETIGGIAQNITEWISEARVRIAHGKMPARELERVMQDFYHRRFNVLVCTTIIESGIDVPTANTIIINRADCFGLAQLYQLRGRVGRSHHRAYAYLIVPPRTAMTPDAIKRLEALSALEELGMGFTLATHDLEIRGAGELLGSQQSGHMQEIGFTLYTELLERAIEDLKAGRQPELNCPLSQDTEIDLHSPALIPSDYLPDVHTRLILYKRIATAGNREGLEELQVEMIDRFGKLPAPTKALFQIATLKLKATPLGIRKIDVGHEGGFLLFDEQPNVDTLTIVQLIQNHPRQYQLDGKKLRLKGTTPDFTSRWQLVEQLLQRLSGHQSNPSLPS